MIRIHPYFDSNVFGRSYKFQIKKISAPLWPLQLTMLHSFLQNLGKTENFAGFAAHTFAMAIWRQIAYCQRP